METDTAGDLSFAPSFDGFGAVEGTDFLAAAQVLCARTVESA
jgi:hypothetical protein